MGFANIMPSREMEKLRSAKIFYLPIRSYFSQQLSEYVISSLEMESVKKCSPELSFSTGKVKTL